MYTMHNSNFCFCVFCDFIFELGRIASTQMPFGFILCENARDLGSERWVEPLQSAGYILMYSGFAYTERKGGGSYGAVMFDQIDRETARAFVVVVFQGVHSNTVSEFCIII